MEFELHLEEEVRTYLNSALFPDKSIWLYSDNRFEGICDGCVSLQTVWKVYSYADGYVQFCLNMITKYIESGLLKSNSSGRIKSYEISELLLKTESQRRIPWRMRIFCEKCAVKSEFRGTSSWRSDSNHFFDGECTVCQHTKSGGIKDLRIES